MMTTNDKDKEMTNFCRCDCAFEGLTECIIGDEAECDRLSIALANDGLISSPKTVATASTYNGRQLPMTWSGGRQINMCIHALDLYTLSSGHTVYLSAAYDDRYRDWNPDVGVYLDGTWDSITNSFAYLVPWKDYGMPRVSMESIIRYARTVIEHCDNSETVEIGCLGSHGRTGTFVAILEIVASNGAMSARDAIAKVRAEHCVKCVETEEQEWYINAIRSTLLGIDLPRKPRPKKVHIPKVATLPAPTHGGATLGTPKSYPTVTRTVPTSGTEISRSALDIALERMEQRKLLEEQDKTGVYSDQVS